MAGIYIALAISWCLLYVFQKRNILVLGFFPTLKRLEQFLIGFFLTAILCVGVQYLDLHLKSSIWIWNEKITLPLIFDMLWWDFRSVLTEELLFRGAILFILLEKIKLKKAVLISAGTFGIYHWFSFGIFGNIIPMIFVFIGTGLMGYGWALAFAKTKSILMPTGMHLGWNFTFNSIFSKGPIGHGLLIIRDEQIISNWFSLIGLILVPLLVCFFVSIFVPYEDKENLVRNEASIKIITR